MFTYQEEVVECTRDPPYIHPRDVDEAVEWLP